MATQRTSSAGTGGEVVVGFDGREGARTALSEATGLARDLGAPLVVAFAKGAIVGSTPHKLIQLSPVPVLVVRG